MTTTTKKERLMTIGEISAFIGIVIAVGGVVGWMGRGVWLAAKKDSCVTNHDTAISQIRFQMAAQKKEIIDELRGDLNSYEGQIKALSDKLESHRQNTLTDLKAAVCDAMKLALKNVELRWLEKQSTVEKQQAVTAAEVEQIKRDVDALFSRVRDLEAI